MRRARGRAARASGGARTDAVLKALLVVRCVGAGAASGGVEEELGALRGGGGSGAGQEGRAESARGLEEEAFQAVADAVADGEDFVAGEGGGSAEGVEGVRAGEGVGEKVGEGEGARPGEDGARGAEDHLEFVERDGAGGVGCDLMKKGIEFVVV